MPPSMRASISCTRLTRAPTTAPPRASTTRPVTIAPFCSTSEPTSTSFSTGRSQRRSRIAKPRASTRKPTARDEPLAWIRKRPSASVVVSTRSASCSRSRVIMRDWSKSSSSLKSLKSKVSKSSWPLAFAKPMPGTAHTRTLASGCWSAPSTRPTRAGRLSSSAASAGAAMRSPTLAAAAGVAAAAARFASTSTAAPAASAPAAGTCVPLPGRPGSTPPRPNHHTAAAARQRIRKPTPRTRLCMESEDRSVVARGKARGAGTTGRCRRHRADPVAGIAKAPPAVGHRRRPAGHTGPDHLARYCFMRSFFTVFAELMYRITPYTSRSGAHGRS